jgi:zinc protease
MIRLLVFLGAIAMAGIACKQDGFKVLQLTDANGFKYETVQGDKTGLRIYTLENGLKVYLSANKSEPRMMGLIGIRAGSTSDPAESTGLAHYFEHIMFKGSSEIGTNNWEAEKVLLDSISMYFEQLRGEKDPEARKAIYKNIDALSVKASRYAIPNEYDKMVSEMGAKYTNAFTDYEVTAYMNDIPANELERWLELEYNRFGEVALRLFHTELETVYEEFNMYQDMDDVRADEALQNALFPNHPLGRSIIGLPEHLKNPSMENIQKFKKDWYVPNNMAIFLSGDLVHEDAILLIDKTFGQMEPGDLPDRAHIAEEPVSSPRVVEVVGPDAEKLSLAWRLDAPTNEQKDLLFMCLQILSNGTAGIFDLDLVQNQLLLQANAGYRSFDGYEMFSCQVVPNEGQSLEEARDLVFSAIEKLKTGDFPDWMPEAVANQQRLSFAQSSRNNFRVFNYLEMFIYDQSWIDILQTADRLERLSKKQIMDFASQMFADNYAIVYKRKGETGDLLKVQKPELSRIEINRDDQSAFYAAWQKKQKSGIEPVFLDFDRLLKHSTLREGLDFTYQANEEDDFFTHYYIIDAGKNHHPLAELAFNFLDFVGTDKRQAPEMRQTMFRYGLSTQVYAGEKRTWISMAGLKKNYKEGLELMEELLTQAKADTSAFNKYVERTIKERNDRKLNADEILWGGLINRLKYGPKSSFNQVLSDEELRQLGPDTLLQVVRTFMAFPHRMYYYGPEKEQKVVSLTQSIHKTDASGKIPEPVNYPELPIDSGNVFFVHYPNSQINLMLLGKGASFEEDRMLQANLFNQYFGNSMSSIVFQELREAQGLAYSAYIGYNAPRLPDESFYLMGFIGTQPDKMLEATSSMEGLIQNLVENEALFEVARQSVLNTIASERIVRERVFFEWLRNQDMGLSGDFREKTYQYAEKYSLADLRQFFDSNIPTVPYSYLLVGDSMLIDKKTMVKMGKVTVFTPAELFGY